MGLRLGQRTDRTKIDDIAGERIVQLASRKDGDARFAPSCDAGEFAAFGDFVAEADTAGAAYAAIGEKPDPRAEFLRPVPVMFFRVAPLGTAVDRDVILQFALAGLGAHRTIERVADEQKFERLLARFDYIGSRRIDDHPLSDR